jgi:nitrogen regulatory protein P-II 1
MKLVIAIIRENQLDQVREALIEAGVSRITVNHVSGHGRNQTGEEIYRG